MKIKIVEEIICLDKPLGELCFEWEGYEAGAWEAYIETIKGLSRAPLLDDVLAIYQEIAIEHIDDLGLPEEESYNLIDLFLADSLNFLKEFCIFHGLSIQRKIYNWDTFETIDVEQVVSPQVAIIV